jgi:hypothetical protein
VHPSAGRVLARARALAALVVRARIECMPAGEERYERHEELLGAVEGLGVMRRLEPRELLVVTAKPGRLSAQEHVDASWRAEGLAVLAWALALARRPRDRELVDVEPLLDAVSAPGVRARLVSDLELCRGARHARREQLLLWRERVRHPEPHTLDRSLSIALERRRAAEWLVGASVDYSGVRVAWFPVGGGCDAMTETRQDKA